jgi:hypothetical protein
MTTIQTDLGPVEIHDRDKGDPALPGWNQRTRYLVRCERNGREHGVADDDLEAALRVMASPK